MAKKEKQIGPRILTCAKTGKTFEYMGVGRPPKYHPDVVKEVRKSQRGNAQKRKREANAAKRAALKSDCAYTGL